MSEEQQNPKHLEASTLENPDAERIRFWNGSFVALDFILVIIAVLAMYLQYVVYPSIITNTYGESDLSLHLSLLTFSWNAMKCYALAACASIQGVSALDFFQVFLVVIALANISHYLKIKGH